MTIVDKFYHFPLLIAIIYSLREAISHIFTKNITCPSPYLFQPALKTSNYLSKLISFGKITESSLGIFMKT